MIKYFIFKLRNTGALQSFPTGRRPAGIDRNSIAVFLYHRQLHCDVFSLIGSWKVGDSDARLDRAGCSRCVACRAQH